MTTNSILVDIKKDLGITEDYTHFDPDLIMDINAALAVLNMLGVGPKAGFSITGKEQLWSDYLDAGPVLDMAKKYISMKVKLMFEANTLTSPVVESLNKQLSELGFYLQVSVDPPVEGG